MRLNSLRPSDAYASVNLAPLVQIKAGRLVGAKPLSKPMMAYYKYDPNEQIPVKY